MYRTCAEHACQEITQGRHCEEHERPEKSSRRVPASARARGYDGEWDRVSRRARRAQPWCSDCGSTSRLTADHLPSAWERRARGLPIRLEDVDVVCDPCNTLRGSSRVGSVRAESPAVLEAERLREVARRSM